MKKYKNRAAELKDLIQKVLHRPDFNLRRLIHDWRKVRVADARKRAAETLKRRRLGEEQQGRGSDNCARRSQEASEESA